jgi:hypothetical protein
MERSYSAPRYNGRSRVPRIKGCSDSFAIDKHIRRLDPTGRCFRETGRKRFQNGVIEQRHRPAGIIQFNDSIVEKIRTKNSI